ncbi:MAG: FAD-binding oxidoreductase, partial [Solirubrobacteraceae bacterium]
DDGAVAGAATIGGVVATGDCGPLRHRYGAPRDLLLGMTVALSDGTIARSGGKVIKNVAGYDVAKLFAGSFGTLGMILSVSVRLHPLPVKTATALGASDDPGQLRAAASALAAAPLELEALDVHWRGGRGGLLARSGGAEAGRRAERVAQLMRDAGLQRVQIAVADDHLWARQRAGQRSSHHAIVRVAARPSALAAVLRATQRCGGAIVGRAALGCSYIEVDPEAVTRLRDELPAGAFATLLDAPAALRAQIDVWGAGDGAAVALMRSVKARFDPARACNPGVFVAGI